jgi:alpha-galactosidase
LRTIPVINQIAEQIATVGAPGCMLLNYTNPMAMCCWAVDRAVGIPHVGLCHSVQSTSRRLASYVGLPYEDVTYRVAGGNHMAFFLNFEYRGQDAYPLLFQKLEEKGFNEDRVRFEMMRRTGYFVTESSEHQCEYVPYFIHHGEKVVSQFAIPLDEYLRRCQGVIDSWQSTEARLLGSGGEIEIGPQTHEFGAFIIHSRETGVPRVIYGNVPNTGLISNLPEGCCVEVPCLVDSQGLQPTHVGALPPQLSALCQSNISVQALTVEAALTHQREHIYHAAMADPHTAATLTLDQIWSLCDELLEAHQKVGLLGEFSPVVPHTGRAFSGIGDRVVARLEQRKDELQIALNNPGGSPVEVSLSVCLKSWEGRLIDQATVSCATGPQSIGINKVPVSLPKNLHEGFRATLEGDGVLAIGLSLPPRKKFVVGSDAPAFDIDLAGSQAVRAWIADKGVSLHFRFRVNDSNITLGQLPWSGSSLELFFAESDSASPYQVILVPGKEPSPARLVNAQCEAIEGAVIRQKEDRTGYEIELEVPKKSLRLSENAPSFLIECYANINALGEAHSGGRASLSGYFDAHLGTSLYSFVELAASR